MSVDILLYVLAGLLVLAGLVGSLLPMLPGIPILFGGIWLAAWVDGFQHAGLWTLVLIAVLGALGLLLDFVAGAIGARQVGASKTAIWGALIGTFAGMFFGLPGLLLGPFLGALIGELANGNSILRSAHASVGTWVGMLMGALAKLVLSFMMLGVYLFALLV